MSVVRALHTPSTMQRRFPGQRALRIMVRTVHIGCAAMFLGALTFVGHPGAWGEALLWSGAALIAEELYRYGFAWFRWLQAWVVMGKLCLFALAIVHGGTAAAWAALVLGGLISHAPGRVRQLPLWGSPGPCATMLEEP